MQDTICFVMLTKTGAAMDLQAIVVPMAQLIYHLGEHILRLWQ